MSNNAGAVVAVLYPLRYFPRSPHYCSVRCSNGVARLPLISVVSPGSLSLPVKSRTSKTTVDSITRLTCISLSVSLGLLVELDLHTIQGDQLSWGRRRGLGLGARLRSFLIRRR